MAELGVCPAAKAGVSGFNSTGRESINFAAAPPITVATGAIRGRMEFGNRAGALKFVARFDHNSTELTLLKAQTTGTAVIHLQFDANNSLDIT